MAYPWNDPKQEKGMTQYNLRFPVILIDKLSYIVERSNFRSINSYVTARLEAIVEKDLETVLKTGFICETIKRKKKK